MSSFGSGPRFGQSWAPDSMPASDNSTTFVSLQNLTKVVELVIGEGEDQSRWLLHHKLFADSSQAVQDLIKSTVQEDGNLIRLPEEETHIFAEFVTFLYTNGVVCYSLEKLVRMYVLGHRLQSVTFMEACYKAIKNTASPRYSAETIKHTFDNTTTDDKLRMLLIKQVGRGFLAGVYSWKAEHEKRLLANIMLELMGGVADAVAEQSSPLNTNAVEPISQGSFGQPAPFGQLRNTGVLGHQNNPASLFGTRSSNPSGLFGSHSNHQQQSGGLFASNNQTQQKPSFFGNSGSSAFGSQPSHSSGGLFGQPTQSAGGRLFGHASNTDTAGGLFGNSNQQSHTGGGLFGRSNNTASRPGGLFGNTSPQNTYRELFGQPITTNQPLGGLYSQCGSSTTGGFGTGPSVSASGGGGFGGSTGAFGSNPSVSAFGGGGFGGGTKDRTVPPSQGTLDPQFEPVINKEANGTTNSYQTNTMMPAFHKYSDEELRLADYNAGRKFGHSAVVGTGEFGSSTFGGPNPGSTGGGSGGTSRSYPFGSKTGSGVFSSSTSGGFGQPMTQVSALMSNPISMQQTYRSFGGPGLSFANARPTTTVPATTASFAGMPFRFIDLQPTTVVNANDVDSAEVRPAAATTHSIRSEGAKTTIEQPAAKTSEASTAQDSVSEGSPDISKLDIKTSSDEDDTEGFTEVQLPTPEDSKEHQGEEP